MWCMLCSPMAWPDPPPLWRVPCCAAAVALRFRCLFQHSMDGNGPRGLSVQCINFVDVSEHSSADLLRASRPELGAYSNPSLYMLKFFGDLLEIDVNVESVVGFSNNFADGLASRSRMVWYYTDCLNPAGHGTTVVQCRLWQWWHPRAHCQGQPT